MHWRATLCPCMACGEAACFCPESPLPFASVRLAIWVDAVGPRSASPKSDVDIKSAMKVNWNSLLGVAGRRSCNGRGHAAAPPGRCRACSPPFFRAWLLFLHVALLRLLPTVAVALSSIAERVAYSCGREFGRAWFVAGAWLSHVLPYFDLASSSRTFGSSQVPSSVIEYADPHALEIFLFL